MGGLQPGWSIGLALVIVATLSNNYASAGAVCRAQIEQRP